MTIKGQLIGRPVMFAAPKVVGLSRDNQNLLNRLVELWRLKQPRNVLRQAYCDGHVRPENLGISVPDELVDLLDVVVGWPAKAVFGLADRCIWDGITGAAGDDDPFELVSLLDENRFDVEIDQIIASALTQSVVFITVTPGDVASGEPAVVVMGRSAQWASALWDRSRRRVSAGLTINDVDKLGRPTDITLYTTNEIVHCVTTGAGFFPASVLRHKLGCVPMEALPFEPSLDRPMGRSRISRDVISITQRAMRTILRDDLASEIFTAPGLLLRGVDEETFEKVKKWSWRLGSVKGISRDEDGEMPEASWTPTQSAQPLIEQLRELAAEFAGATSLPLNSLGIVQDNPSSAEAINAAREDLVIKAERLAKTLSGPLSRVYQHAVMFRDGLPNVPAELRAVKTHWGDPAHPSIVSRSDGLSKQITAIPWLAESTVVLEKLGYTQTEITRLLADKKRAEAGATLDRLAALAQQTDSP